MDKRIIVALALVAGCGKSRASCKTSAGELTSYLSSIEHYPTFIAEREFESHHVVKPTDQPHAQDPPEPIVLVSPTEVPFQCRLVTPDDLGEALIDVEAKLRADVAPKGVLHQLDLLVDADVEWGKVVKVAELASAAGFDHLGVIFTRPTTTPLPPPRVRIKPPRMPRRSRGSASRASRSASCSARSDRRRAMTRPRS